MQAELKKDGKIMMCEACDHVFHFSSRPGTIQDCPSCGVSLYRARSNDFIATRHVYAERKEVPQLAEVIRPKFERKLLLTEDPLTEPRVKTTRAKSVKVCEKCYSIQDIEEGDEDRPCPVCFPVTKEKLHKEETEILTEDKNVGEDVEFVAIDFQETQEVPPLTTGESEEVFPDQREVEVASKLTPDHNQASYELGYPQLAYQSSSISIANTSISSHIDFSEEQTGVASPIFKKSNTELAAAYTQIKLPEITGALVENDLWSNFKKQTLISQFTDQLNYKHHSQEPKSRSTDVFQYQIRQVIARYFFLSLCIATTVGVVVWSVFNSF